MKSLLTALAVAVAVSCLAISGFAAEAPKAEPKKATPAAANKGEALFNQHCSMCHPGGGNIINPKKTLSGKDLKANNVKSAGDIVKLMRNPGPGMNKFDEKIVPEKDAKEIAEYILKTFK